LRPIVCEDPAGDPDEPRSRVGGAIFQATPRCEEGLLDNVGDPVGVASTTHEAEDGHVAGVPDHLEARRVEVGHVSPNVTSREESTAG
jgi:hypothetical protein